MSATKPGAFPFTKAEFLLILAKTAFNEDEPPDGRAFLQSALVQLSKAMRRVPNIPAGEVDDFIQHAKKGADNITLMMAAAMLANELPDADFRAALAVALEQDIDWLLRASHAPAARLQ